MYRTAYEKMAEDTGEVQRQTERHVIERSITLMRKAQAAGQLSREWVDATFFVARLWATLLEDLSQPDNALPNELKASLVSIGIWILRKIEDLRQGHATDFTPVIEVSETIRKGLESH
jgi:flagellar biosynthesis activator protein FlaF